VAIDDQRADIKKLADQNAVMNEADEIVTQKNHEEIKSALGMFGPIAEVVGEGHELLQQRFDQLEADNREMKELIRNAFTPGGTKAKATPGGDDGGLAEIRQKYGKHWTESSEVCAKLDFGVDAPSLEDQGEEEPVPGAEASAGSTSAA